MATPGKGIAWDPLVRLTHWLIALAIVLNGLVTEGGDQIHVWIGYGVLAVLVLRLGWGLIGPEEARFSSFPPSLSGARAHIREMLSGVVRPRRSHDPLGALMAYAIWATLAVVVATGIWMKSEPFEDYSLAQPAATVQMVSYDDDDGEDGHGEREGEEVIEEIHEIGANLLLILAALHVVGVVVEGRRTREPLVKSMTVGLDGNRKT